MRKKSYGQTQLRTANSARTRRLVNSSHGGVMFWTGMTTEVDELVRLGDLCLVLLCADDIGKL